MDEFRQKRNPRKQPSLDGFVVGRRPKNGGKTNRPTDGLRSFDQYYKPRATGSAPGKVRDIGMVGKSLDGFTSSTQSVISHSRKEAVSVDLKDAFAHTEEQSVRNTGGFEQSGTDKKLKKAGKKSKRSFFRRKKDKVKAKPTRRQLIKRFALVAGALVMLVGAGLLLRGFLLSRDIFKGGGSSALLHGTDVDPSRLNGEGDGRINILLLGKGGVEQTDGPQLTDTIIVASIDPIANETALLSIPRDFWVKSDGYASKINEVYANARTATLNNYTYQERDSDEAIEAAEESGVEALKKVVSETMGVPIHYYSMIDFAGFRKAIDTVGGIDVYVDKPLVDWTMAWKNNGNGLIAAEGWQKMNGKKALMYARSRKGTDGTDFGRSNRQRKVIIAMKEKVLSTGTLANPIKLNQLISDFSGQLTTDFTVNEMLRLYDIFKEIPSDKVVSVGLDEYVGSDTAMVGGLALSIQVPKAGWFDYSEIQNYVRNIMRDAFLKQEDAKVMILNGTSTAGQATKMSTELKSYGYNIISIGDAPTSTYSSTVIVDLRNGQNKYTRNYLEKRLGVTATGNLPDDSITTGDADFVIIIGSDQL